MSETLYSISSLNKILKIEKPSKVCFVTSKFLAKKLGWVMQKLNGLKPVVALIPDGEIVKEWNEVEKLLKKFVKLNLDRSSIVVALGGGTVGDMAGFASSVYLRGIRYIQVPTTLLAQVDSAHGGKTGINFLKYKNQIGSFHLPIATIIDTRFLKTLSTEQIVDGLGEIIKAGIIKDPSILSLLQKESVASITSSKLMPTIISKTIKVKEYFVKKDLKDSGSRQLLNFGHTIGHAVETGYKISHGKSVIIGMLQELAFTESLKLTLPSVRKNLVKLLSSLGIKIDSSLKTDWRKIMRDKKIISSKITFPVVEKEGKSKLVMLDLKKLKRL